MSQNGGQWFCLGGMRFPCKISIAWKQWVVLCRISLTLTSHLVVLWCSGEGSNEEHIVVEYAMPLPAHVKIGGATAEEALERFLQGFLEANLPRYLQSYTKTTRVLHREQILLAMKLWMSSTIAFLTCSLEWPTPLQAMTRLSMTLKKGNMLRMRMQAMHLNTNHSGMWGLTCIHLSSHMANSMLHSQGLQWNLHQGDIKMLGSTR